jgi:hypothetical protein
MGANRDLHLQGANDIRNAFSPTIELVKTTIGDRAFKPKRALNAAVFDSVMVGLARRLRAATRIDHSAVVDRYETLLTDSVFVAATERSTTDEESVRKRLDTATMFFARV